MDGVKGRGYLIAFLVLASVLAVSAYRIYENSQAFMVSDVLYASDYEDGWFKPGMDEGKFRGVNLPYFKGLGYFRIHFTSNVEYLELDLYADDCIMQAYVDGEEVYDERCSIAKHSDKPLRLVMDLDSSMPHTLAVKTGNFRENTVFFIEHDENAFMWRLAAILSGFVLLAGVYLKSAGRNIAWGVRFSSNRLWENKGIISLLLASAVIRMALMPVFVSTDIMGTEVILAENMVHKQGLDFSKIDRDYIHYLDSFHTSEDGGGKPPGVTYLLALIRTLFGFSGVYYRYLIKLPALLGDMIIGYAIFDILKNKMKCDRIPLLAAAFYLFNPGVLNVTAYSGKADSLGIGLLLLALKNIEKRRFSVYYGLSVVCKQFPLLLLPWLILQKRMLKELIAAGIITTILLSPYLVSDYEGFIRNMAQRHLNRRPEGMSWMRGDYDFGFYKNNAAFGTDLIAAYILVMIILSLTVKIDGYAAAGLAFGLFIVSSKVVFEQYLLWIMPFLLLVFFTRRRVSALIAFIATTALCMVFIDGRFQDYRFIQEWSLLLVAVMLAYAMEVIAESTGLIKRGRGVS